MEETTFKYLVLVAALIPVAIGFSQSRKVSAISYAKSSKLFLRGGLLVAIGTGLAIVFGENLPLLIGTAMGMLLVGIGLSVQSKELEVFRKFADEQRVDIVSGLPNERLFYERLAGEHSRTKRTDVRYSVAIFEIDGYALFSEVDQLNGMRLLAESMSESIRKTDTLGRIGERQVAVLLVDTQAQGAVIGCDRACERFFFQSCGHSETAHVTRPMTLSVGIASFDEDTVDPQHVVDNAKLALHNLQSDLGSGIRIFDRDDFARPFADEDDDEPTLAPPSNEHVLLAETS